MMNLSTRLDLIACISKAGLKDDSDHEQLKTEAIDDG